MATSRAHQLARHIHVGTILWKRNSEKIRAYCHCSLDVVHVFGRQRRCGQPAALAIDTLVIRQHTTYLHLAFNAVAAHRHYLENDQAIVKQQHVFGLYIARQFFVVDAHLFLIAQFAIGIEHKRVAVFQGNFVVFESADSDFWPL